MWCARKYLKYILIFSIYLLQERILPTWIFKNNNQNNCEIRKGFTGGVEELYLHTFW